MKKINLLSKAEMKNVLGGVVGMANCTASCPGREDVTCEGASCSKVDGVGCVAVTGDTMELWECSSSPIKEINN